MSGGGDADRLFAMLRASPTLMRVLHAARDLDLPDWLVVSGAVYQTAWNAITGRDPDFGIKDYDLFYFDPDPSWEAEDAVICRAAQVLPPDLAPRIEVRNQARVHLWFPQKFREPYPPLASSAEALERFVSPAFAVGARLHPDDRLTLAAPFGLTDLLTLTLRPNPARPRSSSYARITTAMQTRWPELTVL